MAEILDQLGERDVLGILKQVVDLEKRTMEIIFPAGGSLYFAEDLENVPGVSGPIKGIPPEDMQFCVGPETSCPVWFGRRSQLDVDRGPYTTHEVWWALTVQVQLLHEAWPLELLECEDGKPLQDSQGRFVARGLSVRMVCTAVRPCVSRIPSPIEWITSGPW